MARIIRTRVGLTDVITGELLDLTPLRRKPATRRVSRSRYYARKRTQWTETMFTVSLVAVVSCVFWLTFTFGA